MASVGLLGFIKGASDVALDRLEARDKAEQELKKEKMLEELRLSTNKELEDYKDLLESKNVDEDLSSIDLAGGKRILRNKKGTILGESSLTDAERAAAKGSLDKMSLDQEATRADIEQSKASAEASRASAGYSRAAAANVGKSDSGAGLDSTPDSSDPYRVGRELMAAFKGPVSEAEKAGVSSSAIAEMAAQAALAALRAGSGQQGAQALFLETLKQNTQRSKAVTDDETAPLITIDSLR